MMRARALSLLIAAAALSCATHGASAQTAYSYPWCGSNGGGENCYYATEELCIATTAGPRGGRCYANPIYRRDVATRSERTAAPRVTDRAAVRVSRTAAARTAPEARSVQPSAVTPQRTPVQLAQDYDAILSSAELGDVTSQYNLALMYDSGRGVLQDYVLAHKWYNLAASRFTRYEADIGARAANNRDRLTAKMTPAQVAEAQRMAREWEPKR